MKNQQIHYCKADKHTGKPIIVTDLSTGKARNTRKWTRIFENNGVKWRCSIEFNNSKGKAKQQGATSVLKVERID